MCGVKKMKWKTNEEDWEGEENQERGTDNRGKSYKNVI